MHGLQSRLIVWFLYMLEGRMPILFVNTVLTNRVILGECNVVFTALAERLEQDLQIGN